MATISGQGEQGHVEIELDAFGFGKVKIDGREVPELVSFSFDSGSPGDAPIVNLRILAQSLHVKFAKAAVTVTEYDPSSGIEVVTQKPSTIQIIDGSVRQVEVKD